MRALWLIPAALVAFAATALLSRARRNRDVAFSNEPVSSDWLAQARARDENPY